MKAFIFNYITIFFLGFSGGFVVHSALFPRQVIKVEKMKMKDSDGSSQNFVIDCDTVPKKKRFKLFKKRKND